MDLIIEGNIRTLSNSVPHVEAVGVKQGKIVATGSIMEIKAAAHKNTEYLDLHGKTVLPGFFDTHMHPVSVGRAVLNLDLAKVTSIKAMKEKLQQQVDATPSGETVIAVNFFEPNMAECRVPTRMELDEISTEHPIAIKYYDGHSAIFNSPMAALTDVRPGMDGVAIGSDGALTGLVAGPAVYPALMKIQPETDDSILAYTGAAVQEALKVGITSLHMKDTLKNIEIILQHEADFPVHIKPLVMVNPGDVDILDDIINTDILRDRATICLFADGAPDSKTAAYFEPYLDDPANYGVLYYTDRELERAVEKIHTAGFQASIHTCGTRATEQAISVYENVLNKYPRSDHRHRIEHFEMPLGDQIKRAIDAGITFGMQPSFLFYAGEETINIMIALLGPDRTHRFKPLRAIMDRGGLIAGGSDASVTPMNPLQGIFACVNHPIEKHRITRHEALRLFTINGAMIGFEENFKGCIENGKLADFVVLCDDIYQFPPDKIGDIRVEMTIVGGKIVYQAD
jgi:predicted amidohydrolase YtcJ